MTPARKLQAAAPARLVVFSSSALAAADAAAVDELPLWRHLQEQEGFSQATFRRLQQGKVSGKQYSADKVQRNLAPNMAALQREGLTTPNLEHLYMRRPLLYSTTHDTFMSSLAVVRDLAEHLDSSSLPPLDPPLTRLGAALIAYPGSGAYLLMLTSSTIAAAQRLLHDELGVSSAEFAAEVFKNTAILFRDTARARRMAKHLQHVYGRVETGEAVVVLVMRGLLLSHWRLISSTALSAAKRIALRSTALRQEPAEFDRRVAARAARLGTSVEEMLAQIAQQPGLANLKAGAAMPSLDALVEVIGRLMQAAEGMQADAPLQLQHREAVTALLNKAPMLQMTPASSVQSNWDYLRSEGLADSQIWATFQKRPTLMACDLRGAAMQLKAAWVEQVLGLAFDEFFVSHPSYVIGGLPKMAMRADYLKVHGQWDGMLARGHGPLLCALTQPVLRFCKRPEVDCSEAQLAAFERQWQQSAAGRRWGVKTDRRRRKPASN